MKIDIVRVNLGERGVYGFMSIAGAPPSFLTLELPWKENQRRVSCIPAGGYQIKRHISPKFGEVFKVMDVEGRDEILIHAGNYLSDIQGCILIGKNVIPNGIGQSKIALVEFMKLMGGINSAFLSIK